MRKPFVFILFILLSSSKFYAQELVLPQGLPEYTITSSFGPEEGYIFMLTRPVREKKPASLLIVDNYGTPIFFRKLSLPSGGLTLNRNKLLSFRSGKEFFVMDSAYNMVDTIGMKVYAIDGHDFLALENGHYIIFGADSRTVDLTEFGGVSDATVNGAVIQELDEDHTVVFEWNSWDHFEISDTYNDITVSSVEVVHPNSLAIDYDGAILLVSRAMNEVTKISRETGEVVWRLGGKNNQFTFSDSSHMFSMPHDFRLLENGNYTIFDNGNERDPSYSRALEYHIDEVAMTCDLVWEYDANKEVFAPSGGSCRRLPGGNTILGFGGQVSKPAVIEVHPDGTEALRLEFVDEFCSARAMKFDWKTTMFETSTELVNFGEWDGYTNSEYLLGISNNTDSTIYITGYSTHTSAFTIDEVFPLEIAPNSSITVTLLYYPSEIDHGYVEDVLTLDYDINTQTLVQRVSRQVKLLGTLIDTEAPELTFTINRAGENAAITSFVFSFQEPVFGANNTRLDYSTVDELITLKKGSADGENIPFDAVINTELDIITVYPEDSLWNNASYYISFSDQYFDYNGNQGQGYSELILGAESMSSDVQKARVYPNPGKGLFYLDLPDNSNYQVLIQDLNGRVFKEHEMDSSANLLDLSNLENGMYVLVLRKEDHSEGMYQLIIKSE